MDAAERTRVTVDIYGNQFKLTGHNNPDYIKRIAALVDENMKKLAKGYPRLDLPKIAVLAAVHMAEDCIRLNRENEQMHVTEERRIAAVAELEQAMLIVNALQEQLDESLIRAEAELALERESAREELELISAGLQGRLEKALLEAEQTLASERATALAELEHLREEHSIELEILREEQSAQLEQVREEQNKALGLLEAGPECRA